LIFHEELVHNALLKVHIIQHTLNKTSIIKVFGALISTELADIETGVKQVDGLQGGSVAEWP